MGFYKEIGIHGYFTGTPAINVDDFLDKCNDFVVREKTSIYYSPHGKFNVYVLVKNAISSNRAFLDLKKKWNMDIKGYFGLKDENSLSIQHFISDSKPLNRICLGRGVAVWKGLTNRRLLPGTMDSNIFYIKLPWTSRAEKTFSAIASKGFIPNYYGHQRFGYERPLNHEKALRRLRSWENDPARIRTKSTIVHGVFNPYQIEEKLVFESLQAFVFNECLSRVLIHRPLCSLIGKSGVLPGYNIESWRPPSWVEKSHYECVLSKLSEMGVLEAMRSLRGIIRTLTRPLTAKIIEIRLQRFSKGKACLTMELPPSSYASIVLNEFFKENEEWIHKRCRPVLTCPTSE